MEVLNSIPEVGRGFISQVWTATLAEMEAWRLRFPDYRHWRAQGLLYPDPSDAYQVVLLSAIFGVMIPLIQFWFLPWLGRLGGLKSNSRLTKFSDAALQVIYYSIMSVWEGWVCFSSTWAFSGQFFLREPYAITSAMRWVYIVQLAWYFYGVGLIVFVPRLRRKDAVAIGIHHAVTIGVVLLSYFTDNTRIGLVVFAVHDPADVFLNGAKVFRYFGYGKACDGTFIAFAITWLVTRVTLFPMVIYTCWEMIKVRIAENRLLPGDFSATVCLSALFCLHVYWTYLILRMAWRAVIIKSVEKDIRSDSDSEQDHIDAIKRAEQFKKSANYRMKPE